VAINTTLVSDTNNTDDLGTSSIRWRDLYLSNSINLNGSGAGFFELAEGSPPTVVANRLTFTAPADAPASGLVYVLPADTPTTGQILSASISGTTVTLSWENDGGGGGGSGTVNSGTAARLAFYATTGTAVSETGAFLSVDNTNSVINALGGMRINRTATATNYSVLKSDRYIGVTDTGAARTITLPDLGTADAGTEFTIADESNGAMANPITIQAGGSDTFIAGISGPVVIDVNNGSVTLMWTGTSATAGWRIK
jgi:hypothetical protein